MRWLWNSPMEIIEKKDLEIEIEKEKEKDIKEIKDELLNLRNIIKNIQKYLYEDFISETYDEAKMSKEEFEKMFLY